MVPAAFCRSNSGDSSMVERAIQTVPARAAPNRKGMRQPQLCRLASSSKATVSAETPTASSAPISLAADASEATRPRRCGRRAFEQIGDDAGIFAADREAHHAAQEEQQPGRPRPDLREVGSRAVASIAAVITATDSSSIRRRP